MDPLTAGNTRVKEARKLSRRSVRSERRLFLADGPKAVEGALEAPDRVVEVFATPRAAEEYDALLAGVAVTLVEKRAMAGLSDSVTPAGVVAVCRFIDRPLDALMRTDHAVAQSRSGDHRLLAICADIRDPGNAGTVIRCADAAGAAGVVLAGDSVDAYNPKTVRASVGSLFHLPFAVERDPAAAIRAAQAAGYQVLAADGRGELDLFESDDVLTRPTAWLFGNEAHGLPEGLTGLADGVVSIPILGRAESLNLATAAALCLYASARAMMRA
ncbi:MULTISPECIES: TrmH family RNA methyltransferase [Nocardioides]|uniref:TrmH family RNA methyltransferase n=1 Tax=Nocardioides vastitatis TaxID=2568655 RepID=A0ABW0ZMR1_9ACTN|nr:RNA methyltransferase [Nocardioides sp.]THI99429.1 RNA methyltransferase [Nocardioides sp.]